jgi:DNA-directed RNA polymerase subunit omega
MARITVEDCLEKEQNRFSLVQLASKRTKQLLTGAKPLVDGRKGNKAVVNSLREIAAGLVGFKTEEDLARERAEEEQRRQAELALAAEQESISTENIFITTPVSSDVQGSEETVDALESETPAVEESSPEAGDAAAEEASDAESESESTQAENSF